MLCLLARSFNFNKLRAILMSRAGASGQGSASDISIWGCAALQSLQALVAVEVDVDQFVAPGVGFMTVASRVDSSGGPLSIRTMQCICLEELTVCSA